MSVRLPGDATAIVVEVQPGGPAAGPGLRPGDVVTAVNGGPVPVRPPQVVASPALDPAARRWTPASLGWIPASAAVDLALERPSSGQAFTVTLQARQLPPSNVAARVLPGEVTYVRIDGFPTGTGDQVLADLRRLAPDGGMRGVVIDIRGNDGGDPSGVVRILSALVHDRTIASAVDGAGHRSIVRTDDSVPLLHQRLVVLIDGGSVSASELMAAAVRDLHLGHLVGERTAGVAAGAGLPFLLDDGSVLRIDTAFLLGPNAEIIDGIGVPADQAVPLTSAADLSSGSDPGIAQALRDLSP
jgi:carboxyl-terminal processing protease